MTIPKIPAWCLPWKARREMARLEGELDAVTTHHTILEASHKRALDAVEELKMKVVRHQHAISSLTAWIFATHKIDERAKEHGLVDILKEFPRK